MALVGEVPCKRCGGWGGPGMCRACSEDMTGGEPTATGPDAALRHIRLGLVLVEAAGPRTWTGMQQIEIRECLQRAERALSKERAT